MADDIVSRAAQEARRLNKAMRAAGVDAGIIKTLRPVVENTAWMKIKLDDARGKIRDSQIVISYDNGGGQKGIRESPAFKGYESLWKAYMLGMGRLLDCMSADAAVEARAKVDSDSPGTVLDMIMARRRKQA